MQGNACAVSQIPVRQLIPLWLQKLFSLSIHKMVFCIAGAERVSECICAECVRRGGACCVSGFMQRTKPIDIPGEPHMGSSSCWCQEPPSCCFLPKHT